MQPTTPASRLPQQRPGRQRRTLAAHGQKWVRFFSVLSKGPRRRRFTEDLRHANRGTGMHPLVNDIETYCEKRLAEAVIEYGEQSLTGEQFLLRARGLADDLRALGVPPHARVGLRLVLGGELLTSLAGIWLARTSFVPLGLREAPARLRRITGDSELSVILTQNAADLDTDDTTAHALLRNGRITAVGRTAPGPVPARIQTDEAYVIFTSGSTGRPKGVSVGHRAIAGYVHHTRELLALPAKGMRFPAQLPPTFDAVFTSLLLPLATGHTAVPLPVTGTATQALATYLADPPGPLVIKTTPSQLELLRSLLTPHQVHRLTGAVVIGGEALDFHDLTWLRSAPGLRLVNEYGPTEATIGCATYHVTETDPHHGPVPIGYPHPGTSFTLRPGPGDTDGTAVGELVISGPSVANGYVNAPDSSAFTHPPHEPARYHTGDRVRRDADSAWHYLGRTDDQIKINGYRVELAEVDEALRTAAHGAPAAALHLDGAITAVFAATTPLDLDAIDSSLGTLLPDFMRPTHLRQLPHMPMTLHGKTDRTALRALIKATPKPDIDPLPSAISAVWNTLLGQFPQPGSHFFTDGATSMTALRLAGRLTTHLGQDVPPHLIFDHPTYADYLTALRAHLPLEPAAETTAVQDLTTRTLAPAQLAVLSAELGSAEAPLFTVVHAVQVTGITDWAALEDSARVTLHRHDVFSWSLGSGPRHRLTARGGPDRIAARTVVESVDLSARTVADAERTITERLATERGQPTDLFSGDGPHTRVLIFHRGADNGICALITHHALSDEQSTALFWQELFTTTGRSPQSAGYDTRYARWAERASDLEATQHATAAAEALARTLTSHRLGRFTASRDTSRTGPGAPMLTDFALPPSLGVQARAKARQLGVPLSALYGTAAVHALRPYITSRRFPLFMPMTQRRTEDDLETIGCFVTSLPVLADLPDHSESAADSVHRWHKAVLHTASHIDADASQLMTLLRVQDPQWAASPRLSLVLQTPAHGLHPPLRWEPVPLPGAAARDDLTFFLTPDTGRHPGTGRLVWKPGILQLPTATALTQDFLTALDALCAGGDLPDRIPAPEVNDVPCPVTRLEPRPGSGTLELAYDLAVIAATILKRPVAPDEDLFRLGASSLDVTRLIAAIDRGYGIRILAIEIFDAPTMAELSVLLSEKLTQEAGR
ncbi:AMP-binding protein [Streptomyces sp. NPDC006285]|uniref:AMP-binding protein n=1 Tax=Streptomyces sp. NPDC006285 TaxID=3364742 RepID=UPI0036C418E5